MRRQPRFSGKRRRRGYRRMSYSCRSYCRACCIGIAPACEKIGVRFLCRIVIPRFLNLRSLQVRLE